MPTIKIGDIEQYVGQPIGTSKWFEVDQSRIDRFADLTEDHQFIHVDPEAAAQTPLGGTIAHGFLTLSLMSAMAAEGMLFLEEGAMALNYGFDKLRFLQPVPAGARVRGHFRLLTHEERKPGEHLFTFEVTVEIENIDKPALVAQWLGLQITN